MTHPCSPKVDHHTAPDCAPSATTIGLTARGLAARMKMPYPHRLRGLHGCCADDERIASPTCHVATSVFRVVNSIRAEVVNMLSSGLCRVRGLGIEIAKPPFVLVSLELYIITGPPGTPRVCPQA
jgi:hypothetical protein